MNRTFSEKFKRKLVKFFIKRPLTPSFLQLFFLGFQMLFFVWLVAMKSINSATIQTNVFNVIIPVALSITILVRLFTTYLLIRPMYIPFIAVMCMMNLSPIHFICGIMIGIMILVQILSSIECDFETNNIDSETFNINKFFHYSFMIFATILQFIQLPIPLQPIIKNGACMVFLIVVFIMKAISKLRNMQTKNIYLRFYLLCFFYFKVGIIVQFVSIPSIAIHAYAIIVSQVIYTLIECYFRGIPIQQYISKDQHSLLAFILLSYLYSNHFDKTIQQGIEKFLSSQSLMQNQRQMQIKNSMIQNLFLKKSAGDLIRKVSYRLLTLITSNSSEDILIKIQICLHIFGKVIMAKNLIEKGKSKISCLNFIQRIHYYRMEQKMKRVIRSQYQLMNSEQQHFDSFLQNEHFTYQLVRGCHAYIQLLEYLCTTELIYEKLQKSINRVLKQNSRTLYNHSKSSPLCLKLLGLYLDYLYFVERDVERAKNLLQKTMFNIDYEISLKTDSKIYIKLKLDSENFFQIGDIGCNIKSLVGYSRKDIKGMRHTVFLPQFYADTHQSLVQQLFIDKTAYTYCKYTLIKHAQGHYLPCFVDLRLRYMFGLGNQGQIQMIGYLQMLEEQDLIEKYNWLNYFFVRTDNGEIIEYSSNVNELKHEYKKINMISDLLDLQLSEINFSQPYSIVRGQSNIDMVPYKRFKTKNIEVVMYVQLLSKKVMEFGQKTPILKSYSYEANLQFLKKSLKKYELKNNSIDSMEKTEQQKIAVQNFLLKKNQLLTLIYSKIQLILILVFFFLVLSTLGIQIYTLQAIYQDSENRNSTLTSGYQLIRHEMSTSTLVIMANNQYLKSNFNYTNDQYQYKYFEYGSELERTNNLFKEYSKNSYMILSNEVQYPVTTYQLISSMYAYLFTNMYLQLPVLEKTSMAFLFNNLRVILIDSYDEYQKRVVEQLENHDKLYLGVQTGITVMVFLIALVSFILILIIERRKRYCEFETFSLISGLNSQSAWMNNIKQCLRRITSEQNYQTSMEDNMKNWSNFNENQKFFEEGNKGDISAREDSMRNLILSSNHSSRNRFQQTDSQIMSNHQSNSILSSHQNIDGSFAKDPLKKNRRSIRIEKSAIKHQDKAERIELKIKSISKGIVILSFIFFLIICSMHLSRYLFDNFIKKFNQVDAVNNLLYLAHKDLRFSNAVSAFIAELTHSEQRIKTFEKNLAQYNLADQKIVFFQQSSYSEFNQFSQSLRNFRYKYLCDYTECKEAYASQINIIFSTTIQKLIYYMQQTIAKVDKTTLKTYLDTDKANANDFGILLYTERLLQKVMMDLINIYMVNFEKFEAWDKLVQVAMIIANIAVISLGILIILIFFYLIWRHKKYQFEVLNLVKQSSYHFEIEQKKQQKIDNVVEDKKLKQPMQ